MIEPLSPSDLDLRDFDWMPLDVKRLRDSDLSVLAPGDAFRAAVLLWCASWHQVPAGSLPADNRLLSNLAGYGRDLKGWGSVKANALRGFVECSDGRLYHPVVCEKAIEAHEQRKKQRKRTEAATSARRGKDRDDDRDDDRNDQRDESHNDKPNDPRNEDHLTLPNQDKEESSGVEERAREPVPPRGKSLISEEAFEITSDLLKAMGLASDDPVSVGAPMQIQSWINGGWARDVIVTGVQRGMKSRRGDPPSTFRYFENAIARAHAEFTRDLPKVEFKPAETITVTHGTAKDKSVSAVARRFAEQFESQSSDSIASNPDAFLRLSQG